MTIGYRFCGSCNPHINTLAVLEKIKKLDDSNRYVYWEKGGYDALLIIGGCPRNCTRIPDFSVRIFKISGCGIDGSYIPEKDLAAQIIKKIKTAVN